MAPYNKRDSSPITSETGRIRAAQTNRDVNIQGILYKNSITIRVKMLKDFTRN